MKKKRISIDIGPEAQIAYSMAFNAFSIRAIGEIIIFAFILKDDNNYILNSKTFSIMAKSSNIDRESLWPYAQKLKSDIKEEDYAYPQFMFKDVENIERISFVTSPEFGSEVMLLNFSHAHVDKKAKESLSEDVRYLNASISATFRSTEDVHKAFVLSFLNVFENIRNKEAKK